MKTKEVPISITLKSKDDGTYLSAWKIALPYPGVCFVMDGFALEAENSEPTKYKCFVECSLSTAQTKRLVKMLQAWLIALKEEEE